MAQATLQNQKAIMANQKTIVRNQDKILRNQQALLKNQKQILANQGRILKKSHFASPDGHRLPPRRPCSAESSSTWCWPRLSVAVSSASTIAVACRRCRSALAS